MTNYINYIYFLVILFGVLAVIKYIHSRGMSTEASHDAMLTPEELLNHAIELGQGHSSISGRKATYWLMPRINDNFKVITSGYNILNENVKSKKPIVPASEWLLDNYYIIEQQVKEIRQDLTKKNYVQLPTLKDGPFKGYPRIYAIAIELIAHTDGMFDEKVLTDFIQSYQSQSVLTGSELWALSMMVKVSLIENIRQICDKMLESQKSLQKVLELTDELLIQLNKSQEDAVGFLKENLKDSDILNTTYSEYLLNKVKKQGPNAVKILQYLDKKLDDQGTNAENIAHLEHSKQAARQVSMGNTITSLKLVSNIDWTHIFEVLSRLEGIMEKDPAGIYKEMNFESRDYYRHEIARISKVTGTSEIQIASMAIECARRKKDNLSLDERHSHVGYYVIGNGKEELLKELRIKINSHKRFLVDSNKINGYIYAITIGVITLLVMGGFIYLSLGSAETMGAGMLLLISVLSLVPAVTIATGFSNWFFNRIQKTHILPKIELKDGMPEEAATMVAVPTLLPGVRQVKDLIDRLEVYYLANREKNIFFSLVGDFKDSPEKELDNDGEIAEAALQGVKELNNKYSEEGVERFFFCVRERKFNSIQKKWMGWERKRGALVEFNRLLRGSKDTSFFIISTDIENIPYVKYVITLDADTTLPMDAAKKLVGTILHPLHKPIVDKNKKIVVDGYGLLQPGINVAIDSANKTMFSRIFAGQGGLDPYTTAVSDIYQDLFGEGIFTGKGIYDIDVFNDTLSNAIPDNSVLSHDLLEGCYLRVGLVTDINLVDSYPGKYNSYIARLHRWVRGDWQLLPWLFRRIKNREGRVISNPLNGVSRWKILDNIRRSLVEPMLLILILLGFSVLPGNPIVWLTVAFITMFFPLITGAIDSLICRNYRFCGEKYHTKIIQGLKGVFYQTGLLFIFLPYQGYMMLDAILRTIFRVFFSKKNMLEWVTAADTERRLKNDAASFWKRMWICVPIGVLVPILSKLYSPEYIIVSMIVSLSWIFAPHIAYMISKNYQEKKYVLSNEDIKELRRLSAKTWRYFEDFVTAKDNYLPPDNYQEEPPNGIAHRTSPTNIGLFLVSVLSARDFGYISTVDMLQRLENTIDTIKRLPKWRGHIFNWYDTRSLKVLRPQYVSTVDSGNFVGYLIVLNEGVKEYLKRPFTDINFKQGLRDTIELLKEECDNISIDWTFIDNRIDECNIDLLSRSDMLEELVDYFNKEIKNIEYKKCKSLIYVLRTLKSFIDEKELIIPWYEKMITIEENIKKSKLTDSEKDRVFTLVNEFDADYSLLQLSDKYEKVLSEIAVLKKEYIGKGNDVNVTDDLNALEGMMRTSFDNIRAIINRFNDLINTTKNMVDEMDFRPLFDEKRQFFSIGYSVDEESLTKSYYDLMGSEARQISYIAIAKGQINQKHWFHLGRSLTTSGGYKGLVSWSGTMFEYLMPLLTMKNYPGTLWDETYWFILRSQKKYGEKRKVPWGTSESGFYAFDMNLNYQYKAFGVPDLGLKRGLIDDMVVAPYSAVMALMVDAQEAIKNIRRLYSEGLDGFYGLYEAIDYTPERLTSDNKSGIVKSYMIHHQGMGFLALNNCLNNNIIQERFHKDPHIKAAELLLHEKVPSKVIITKENKERVTPLKSPEREYQEVIRSYGMPDHILPRAHILSNGNYSVMLTDSGSGYSKRGEIMLSRWRSDIYNNNYGMFFYIQNINSNNVWTATFAPYHEKCDNYKVIFSPHKVEYFRKDGNLDTHTEVVVSAEDNAEIRRISLTNHSEHSRTVEITSYSEVTMTMHQADIAHPAFSNLFVRTEFIPEYDCLVGNRRPRIEGETEMWVFHNVLIEGAENVGAIQYETDRSKFIGRGRSLRMPIAMDVDRPLSNTVGSVLDPIMSLRCRVVVNPGNTVNLSFTSGVADNREEVIKLAEKYHDVSAIFRAFELSWTRSNVEGKHLGLEPYQERCFQRMIPQILFLNPMRRYRARAIKENKKGQSSLWTYGVSGDFPIVLVFISKVEQIDLIKDIIKAHEYWRIKGLITDLIIVNEDTGSYSRPVQELLREVISVSHARDVQNKAGGVFVIDRNAIADKDITLLLAAARIVLEGNKGALGAQIRVDRVDMNLPLYLCPTKESSTYKMHKSDVGELKYFNGYGGFSDDGKEYVIELKDNINTPAPWINVIANHRFGFSISEIGGGYTWSENSRENKITPWSNDPVIDPLGEVFYIRDERTGEVWTPTPSPIRGAEPYVVRHGFGYSKFEYISRGIEQKMTLFVPRQETVKLCIMSLKNASEEDREISVTYYANLVMGVHQDVTSQYIITETFEDTGILLVGNGFNSDYEGRISFMDVSEQKRTYTGDNREFIGKRGSISQPEALKREKLSCNVGAGYMPCGAIQTKVSIKQGEEKKIVFMLGQSKDLDSIKTMCFKYRDINQVEEALRNVIEFWEEALSVVNVSTPDPSMDYMLNGWLLYQTVSCRIFARSAFYQSGGAYGFRDQLQDVMGVLYILPELTSNQILKHASHQFIEGDVQHWWHPAADKGLTADKGIRTKFSDDLVWLPYVTADYIENTANYDILNIEVPYIEAELLGEDEDEKYTVPIVSSQKGSVYEHCVKALERALKFGEHGLPLMGSGDWNDGMNKVGNKGKGESVWLGWFIYTTLMKFIPLCHHKGDSERAENYNKLARNIIDAIEENAWDGSWYRRAYFDDGTPMGSAQNTECKIDSLSQTWAVISGAARIDRINEAMGALEHYLIRKEEGLIMLLTPPFDKGELEPGYIKDYVPGVRENGGQYTHAAIWVVLAFAKKGEGNKAWELFNMINPINHSRTSIEASHYKVEPYVMAADVYAVHPNIGRGGWSWYTGASGWMYRVGIEHILGLRRRGDIIYIDPCIPKEWEEYNIRYLYKESIYEITIKNPHGVNRGVKEIRIDGNKSEENMIKLKGDKKKYIVEVLMG